LKCCQLTDISCASLASALSSTPSRLKDLDLSHNKLRDSGVRLLSASIHGPNCALLFLRLKECQITEEGRAAFSHSGAPPHPIQVIWI
ncbi:hypothetical protein ATANTOWER_003238, partial [Ataeniobius toweri]|nr:hypothetical protein [Ataeniobius toweri]